MTENFNLYTCSVVNKPSTAGNSTQEEQLIEYDIYSLQTGGEMVSKFGRAGLAKKCLRYSIQIF